MLSSISLQPQQLEVSITHESPAYLDEEYPIIIKITNTDHRELLIVVDILLQPSEVDHEGGSIHLLSAWSDKHSH